MCLPPYSQTGVAPKPPLPDKDDRMIPDPTMPPQDLDERSLASIIAPERAVSVMAFQNWFSSSRDYKLYTNKFCLFILLE